MGSWASVMICLKKNSLPGRKKRCVRATEIRWVKKSQFVSESWSISNHQQPSSFIYVSPMTDPWCCHIWYITWIPSIYPLYVSIYIYIYIYQHHGSVMGHHLCWILRVTCWCDIFESLVRAPQKKLGNFLLWRSGRFLPNPPESEIPIQHHPLPISSMVLVY